MKPLGSAMRPPIDAMEGACCVATRMVGTRSGTTVLEPLATRAPSAASGTGPCWERPAARTGIAITVATTAGASRKIHELRRERRRRVLGIIRCRTPAPLRRRGKGTGEAPNQGVATCADPRAEPAPAARKPLADPQCLVPYVTRAQQ